MRLAAVEFSELKNWAENDPHSGLAAFLRSCTRWVETNALLGGANYAGTLTDWLPVCDRARVLTQADPASVRTFFETEFVPYRVASTGKALFTGYYEPEVRGSRTRHDAFQTPLYGVPPDFISPYATRAEIVRNGLANTEPLVYLDDPIDAFFLQIQGSGRVVLDDGSVMRLAYAGQNGHPYTPIGAILVQSGEMTLQTVSMPAIRAWLAAHPEQRDALLDQNASYVFFSLQPLGDPSLGAIGSQGVPLTPEASLAVDRAIHPLGLPIWLETTAPEVEPANPNHRFDRLLVAQDTGGAIKGAQRGDIYWGFGTDAGAVAGRMRSAGRMTVLLPKTVAARLGPGVTFEGLQ